MNSNSEVLSQAIEKYTLNEKSEFTVTECATFIDMAESYIKKLVSKGVLPHKKVDGELRFSRIEIENWMLSKPVPSIKNVAPSQLVAVWGESENVGELCDSKRFAITKSFLSKKVLQSFHDQHTENGSVSFEYTDCYELWILNELIGLCFVCVADSVREQGYVVDIKSVLIKEKHRGNRYSVCFALEIGRDISDGILKHAQKKFVVGAPVHSTNVVFYGSEDSEPLSRFKDWLMESMGNHHVSGGLGKVFHERMNDAGVYNVSLIDGGDNND